MIPLKPPGSLAPSDALQLLLLGPAKLYEIFAHIRAITWPSSKHHFDQNKIVYQTPRK